MADIIMEIGTEIGQRSNDEKAEEMQSNDVVMPGVQDLTLARVAAACITPSFAFPLVFGGVAICSCYNAYVYIIAEEQAPKAWKLMTGLLTVTFPLLSLITPGLRRVTAARGHLERLGAGTIKTGSVGARKVRRWGAFLSAVAAGFIVGSVGTFALGKEIGSKLFTFVLLTIPGIVSAWWLTLKMASYLVQDSIIETRKQMRRCTPGSKEWSAEVIPKTLTLIHDVLPTLSEGWSVGLVWCFIAMWTLATAFVVGALNYELPMLLVALFFGSVPLLLSLDVAQASSDCDTLTIMLNTKRAGILSGREDLVSHSADQSSARLENGDSSEESITVTNPVTYDPSTTLGSDSQSADDSIDQMTQLAALDQIERLLDRCNNQAGLGFVVGGKVVDRRTLKTIFVGMVSLVSTVFPVLVALSSDGYVVGDVPVYVRDDLFQIPSGKLVAVNNHPRNYADSVAYCANRDMVIISLHSQEDCNSIEHLLSGPTYLGATEKNGFALWGRSGDWSWEDGTDWDFQHAVTEHDNSDRLENQMYDETHMVMIPRGWAPTEHTKYTKLKGNRAKLSGWRDWGKGDAELPVACSMRDNIDSQHVFTNVAPTSVSPELCETMSGKLFTPSTASCYQPTSLNVQQDEECLTSSDHVQTLVMAGDLLKTVLGTNLTKYCATNMTLRQLMDL